MPKILAVDGAFVFGGTLFLKIKRSEKIDKLVNTSLKNNVR